MAQTPPRDVSIVIPAYAEERRIAPTLRALRDWAVEFPRLGEVLVVVEPAGDRTAEVARAAAAGDPRITVWEEPQHRGKGHAVRVGMLRARGEFVFFMDAELSVPLTHVAPVVGHLESEPETDVAIGNRRHPGSRITKRQPPLREQAGRLFNCLVRLLGLSVSKDTQCGFKVFRRAAAQEIFSRAQIDGFAFDSEILLLARRRGLRVDELPVEWINDEETKFRPVRDGWRSLRDLLRVRRLVARARP
jgi:glycosyltransferase involved in cell wall biosynthesis